jgi:class 3 adenylate cyclase
MTALPTGTVTLLFTDIEGSTRLWERDPDAMALALARHDTILRSAFESAGGYVFKTVGDAFCASFAAARNAVGAAAEAQRTLHAEPWPDNAAIRVRMALHTGECEERDGDYFGPAVNRVARLVDSAYGDQVVVSRPTAELVRDRLPAGVQLINLGMHFLKDLDRPEEVFQMVVDGVPAAFPPLRSTSELLVSTPVAERSAQAKESRARSKLKRYSIIASGSALLIAAVTFFIVAKLDQPTSYKIQYFDEFFGTTCAKVPTNYSYFHSNLPVRVFGPNGQQVAAGTFEPGIDAMGKARSGTRVHVCDYFAPISGIPKGLTNYVFAQDGNSSANGVSFSQKYVAGNYVFLDPGFSQF